MKTKSVKNNYEQENYIIRKLKFVRKKLYQAYLIPFFVDFSFRMGAALLASLVGAKEATIIAIIVLTLTRIKAVKDLIDVIKGLLETERLQNPSLTTREMFKNDVKVLLNLILIKFNKNNKKIIKNKSHANSVAIILGAIAPMLFDYFSMGIVAKHGAMAVVITQSIDTVLHLSALVILYSNIKKVNEKLHKFNNEYYNQFKSFVKNTLIERKPSFILKIKQISNLKDILKKEKTNQNIEKIRRFLIDSKEISSVIKKAVNKESWEQFYLKFPNDYDYAERSIRKCENKYMIITKIIEKTNQDNKFGYPDSSRDTYTVEINEKRYKEFLELNGDNPIYKLTCYTIAIDNVEATILLDVYKNRFEGLNIARVKFKDSEESLKFVIPKWFGKEITSDSKYTGRHFTYIKE